MEFDITAFISQVGFPIAVAAYSLVKLEKTVRQNTRVMEAIALKLGVWQKEDGEK